MSQSTKSRTQSKREIKRRRQQAVGQLCAAHGQMLAEVGRQAIEMVLLLSAQELAGEKRPCHYPNHSNLEVGTMLL